MAAAAAAGAGAAAAAAAVAAPGNVVRVLRLARFPILEQLKLEEALLRATPDNWLLLNDGAPDTTIVMGISGKVPELLHADQVARRRVPVVRRFTGGGTVIVDGDTVFSTLIMQAAALPSVEPFPQPVMRWTERLYKRVFGARGDFRLREHDYVIGERKFGGNAQAITGRRWLHHTSLLWDYDPANMALLTNPARQPEYRRRRAHGDFLLRLREVLPERGALLQSIEAALRGEGFELQAADVAEAAKALQADYLRQNKVVDVAAEA